MVIFWELKYSLTNLFIFLKFRFLFNFLQISYFIYFKARTQFLFNGCMVQGDSLYIGNNFVRKLTSNEQKELEQFNEELNEYQKALNEQINRVRFF